MFLEFQYVYPALSCFLKEPHYRNNSFWRQNYIFAWNKIGTSIIASLKNQGSSVFNIEVRKAGKRMKSKITSALAGKELLQVHIFIHVKNDRDYDQEFFHSTRTAIAPFRILLAHVYCIMKIFGWRKKNANGCMNTLHIKHVNVHKMSHGRH